MAMVNLEEYERLCESVAEFAAERFGFVSWHVAPTACDERGPEHGCYFAVKGIDYTFDGSMFGVASGAATLEPTAEGVE